MIARSYKNIRKNVSLKDVGALFDHYLPELASKLNIPKYDDALSPTDAGSLEKKFHTKVDRAADLGKNTESKNYFYILLIMKLIDEKHFDLAREFSDFAASQLKEERTRTMDHFIAKVHYFRGLIYERQGRLNEIVSELLDAYRAANHRDDQQTQATVINYILRSYIKDNLYTEAANLLSICPMPKESSHNQQARYMYYEARVKAVQLNYPEA